MSQQIQRLENQFSTSVVATPQPGAIAIETQRATVEATAQIAIAKQFPRNPMASMDAILNECMREDLAKKATYAYVKGGTEVTGPSIRLAETIAREWGNISFGLRELSQKDGVSEIEAVAWDVEKNVKSSVIFQVLHRRSKRDKRTNNLFHIPLEDSRDIYEHIANQGSRRLRSRILAVIPGDVVDRAVRQCQLTLSASISLDDEAIKKMLGKFAEFSVTKEMIEKRLQRRLETITPAQFIRLREIFNSLRDGMSAPSDWFELPQAEVKETQAETLKDLLKIEEEREIGQ